MAERRGMRLMERRTREHDAPYDNVLTLSATLGRQRWTVNGAVIQGQPYIVSINDLWVDFPAEGNILLTSHQDRPGIVGRVGTLLGINDVNISFMHVGRRGPRTEAIMALGTDELVTGEILAQIAAWDDINWLRAIAL